MQLTFRDASDADWPLVDAMRAAVGWGAGSWFLRPVVATGGHVLFALDERGEIAGMGAAARFGDVGVICNMVVPAAMQGLGVGGAVFDVLTSWLEERGVRRIELEATAAGRPLYEKRGFRACWESVTGRFDGEHGLELDAQVRPFAPSDAPALAALDREAYGADRWRFLALLPRAPHFVEWLVAEQEGVPAGFVFRFEGRVGPLAAANQGVARALAAHALARAGSGTIVTIGHPAHSAFWAALGVTISPFDTRMVRGAPRPPEAPHLFAMLNGGVG